MTALTMESFRQGLYPVLKGYDVFRRMLAKESCRISGEADATAPDGRVPAQKAPSGAESDTIARDGDEVSADADATAPDGRVPAQMTPSGAESDTIARDGDEVSADADANAPVSRVPAQKTPSGAESDTIARDDDEVSADAGSITPEAVALMFALGSREDDAVPIVNLLDLLAKTQATDVEWDSFPPDPADEGDGMTALTMDSFRRSLYPVLKGYEVFQTMLTKEIRRMSGEPDVNAQGNAGAINESDATVSGITGANGEADATAPCNVGANGESDANAPSDKEAVTESDADTPDGDEASANADPIAPEAVALMFALGSREDAAPQILDLLTAFAEMYSADSDPADEVPV